MQIWRTGLKKIDGHPQAMVNFFETLFDTDNKILKIRIKKVVFHPPLSPWMRHRSREASRLSKSTSTRKRKCHVTSSTTVAISSPAISPGDFNCFFVVPQGTWSAATVPGDATKVDITMGANTIANDPCYGTVRGDRNNSTKKLTITNKTLPPVDPTGNTCTIHDAEITIPNLNLS